MEYKTKFRVAVGVCIVLVITLLVINTNHRNSIESYNRESASLVQSIESCEKRYSDKMSDVSLQNICATRVENAVSETFQKCVTSVVWCNQYDEIFKSCMNEEAGRWSNR